MPNRTYRGKEPPTARDHFLAHPFEVLLSAGTFAACALIAAAELGAPLTLSSNITALPPLVAWLVALTGLGGHALVLAGLFHDGRKLDSRWHLERVGIVGAVTSWATYVAAIAILHPGQAVSYVLPGVVALAYVVRFVATVQEDKATRATIRSALPPGMQQ